ncbi:protein of unknown function (plasmid) [Caballeronia sp. S22]
MLSNDRPFELLRYWRGTIVPLTA